MRVLRGTLTFVLGMIIGIILFVVAIGGTVFALGSLVSVGDLQNKFNANIINEDSEVYDKSILDVVKTAIDDVKQFDQLSIQKLIDKYGIPVPEEIAGINISAAFQYPLTDISNHVPDIINSVTLRELGDSLGIDWTNLEGFGEGGVPIINDNLDNGVIDAVNAIMASLGNDMTLRDIKNTYGFDLGADDNAILSKLQDVPLSEVASTFDFLRISDIISADTDTFVLSTSDAYVKVNGADLNAQYEQVSQADLKNSSYVPALGITTYIAGVKDTDNDGVNDSLLERELRYVYKDSGYVVDNSCYSAGFDAETTDKVFYRHIDYKLMTKETTATPYVIAYANKVNADKSLYIKGFVKIETNDLVDVSGPVTSGTKRQMHIHPAAPATFYNFDGPVTKDSQLVPVTEPGGYVRFSKGASDNAIKTIALKTLYELQHDDDLLSNLTLSDVLNIDSSSAKILTSLKDTKLKDLGSTVDTLSFDSIININMDTYSEDPDGIYVKITAGDSFYYTLYNPEYHSDATVYTRYSKTLNPDASSKVLQRLRASKIGTFSDDFKNLLLSDVLDIEPELYEAVSYADPSELIASEDYFYYDSAQGLYIIADNTYIASHNKVYKAAKVGKGMKLLQKLAYVKIDNLSSAMESVVDNMYVSDLIDVIDSYAIKLIGGSPVSDEETFLLESTETDDLGDKLTYVYSSQGQYVKRNYHFEAVDKDSLTTGAGAKILFTQVLDQPTAIANIANLYYSENGVDFSYQPQLTTYLAQKSPFSSTNLYTAEINPSGTNYPTYTNSNLYVKILGSYIPYDATSIQCIMQNDYYLKVSGDCYVNINDPYPIDDPSYAYNSLTDVRLAKVYCEDMYLEDGAGTYVFYDNSYILYDPANSEHASLTRYKIVNGYIATTTEAYYKDSSVYTTTLSPVKIEIVNQKSHSILSTLKKEKTTLKNMSTTINIVKIKDLIEIAPDSILSVEFKQYGVITSLKEQTLNGLSSALVTMMDELTVGDILRIANVTTIQPNVRELIKDVRLPEFFAALKYDAVKGIYFDLEVLYGA